MEIFPYVLLRVGGTTFEHLETLNLTINNTFRKCYERKIKLKNEISEILYQEISNLKDSKKQNHLLRIKRDLFNERNFNNLHLSEIEGDLKIGTVEKIRNYLGIVDDLEKLTIEITSQYEIELPGLRNKLKSLSLEQSIQNGLIFSSQSLYTNIEEYRNQNGEYTKSIKKTEVSLIKYLTRTVAKTSPFSSFNNLALGKLEEDFKNGEMLRSGSKENIIKSNIRINNSIFLYIRNCIFKLSELYKHFYIIANPTITVQGNQFNYLINFNNVESFQKIGINPIVEYFLSVVKDNEKITYGEFIKKVMQDEMLDASEEEIGAYIYQLIELGFFEFDINISGLDTGWVNKLIVFLKQLPCESDSRDIIVSTLDFLNEMVPVFERSGILDRLDLSKKALEKFSEMKKHLDGLLKPPEEKKDSEENKDANEESKNKNGEVTKKVEDVEEEKNESEEKKEKTIIKNVQYINFELKPESVFYEDTIIDGEFYVNKEILNNLMSDLQKFLNFFQLFDMRKEEQDSINNYFRKKFNENETVRLLTFYENYISYKKEEKERKEKEEKERKEKEEKERKEKEEKNHITNNKIDDNDTEIKKETQKKEQEIIPEIQMRKKIQKNLFDNIINLIAKENYSANDEVKITEKILKNSIQSADIEYKEIKNTSLGFFLMFYNSKKHNGENEIKAFLNTSFPGYGKMTSRFLHLFPDDFTKKTNEWNAKYCNENILAENIDSGIMNFNLHPALMPNEISIPGGNFVLNASKRIPISRLLLNINKEENSLQIIDENSGKRVYAFDLGFQGYGGRSELFKFLENFTLSKLINFYSLTNRIYEMFKPVTKSYKGKNGSVKIFPRICYNDSIIITRKEWVIPKVLLPLKNQSEKESEYFVRLQKWCYEMELPNEVFIKLNSQTAVKEEKSKPKKNFSRDDYKPQYINFNNPFLVRLFEKNLDKVIDNLRVYEMIPDSEQILKINNQKYVTEFVVQNYNYK